MAEALASALALLGLFPLVIKTTSGAFPICRFAFSRHPFIDHQSASPAKSKMK